MMAAYDVVTISITVFSCLFGIIGNSLVIASVATIRSLQNAHNYMILSLACSDLMVTIVVNIEFVVFAVMEDELRVWIPEHMIICHFISTCCALGCLTSIFSITAVAANRYVAICKTRTTYQRLYGQKKVWIHIVMIWISSASLYSTNYIFGDLERAYDREYSNLCFYDWRSPVVNTLIMGTTFLCFGFVGFFYIKIYLRFRGSSRAVGASASIAKTNTAVVAPTGSVGESSSVAKKTSNSQQSKDMAGERRLAIMAFCIFATFLAAWGLMVFATLAYNYVVETVPYRMIHIGAILSHIASSVNPIIYGIVNKNFREAYITVLQRIFGKKCCPNAGKSVMNTTATERSRKAPDA